MSNVGQVRTVSLRSTGGYADAFLTYNQTLNQAEYWSNGVVLWSVTDAGVSSLTTSYQHAAMPLDANLWTINDTVSGNATNAVRAMSVVATVSGSGQLTAGGHAVALQTQMVSTLTGSAALLVSNEATLANVGGAALTNGSCYLAKVVANTGTITNMNSFMGSYTNSGTITNAVDYFSNNDSAITGGTVTNWYSLFNVDPSKKIVTFGVVQNSLFQELAPGFWSGLANTRSYHGVQPTLGAVGTVGNLLTNIAWCPLWVGGRSFFSFIGLNVVATAAATFSVQIYNSAIGQPIGSPLLATAASISSSASGDVTATINQQLDAGLYFIGVSCTSNTPTISTYTENALPNIVGTSGSTGTNTTPTTPWSGTWGASPALTFTSAANAVPLIYLRHN